MFFFLPRRLGRTLSGIPRYTYVYLYIYTCILCIHMYIFILYVCMYVYLYLYIYIYTMASQCPPGSLHGPASRGVGASPPAAGGLLPRRLVEAAHGLPAAHRGRADQGAFPGAGEGICIYIYIYIHKLYRAMILSMLSMLSICHVFWRF